MAVVGVDDEGLLGVGARLLELHEVVAGGRAQVEEVRGIGGALGAAQRGERPGGLALLEVDRGVHDPQVGLLRLAAQHRVEGDARLLDLALVEQVVDPLDLHPFGFAQRVVRGHGAGTLARGGAARQRPPAPHGQRRPRIR